MIKQRSAKYVRTLVYIDEPQLILLRAHKTNVIAVAVPPTTTDESLFFATTVLPNDLDKYMEGSVDLRYLFTYPTKRSHFYFDLNKMDSDGRIDMSVWTGDLKEEYLPAPRFFSNMHTESEPDGGEEVSTATETLLVDGEWDMPEFGAFYSKYSDIYYFISISDMYMQEMTPTNMKKYIKEAFSEPPYRGGSSYLHLFDRLPRATRRQDRLRMDKIQYASPGFVDVNGDSETFREVEFLVKNYISNRKEIRQKYNDLYKFLSKMKLLNIPAQNFDRNNTLSPFIQRSTISLAESLKISNYDAISELANGNTLIVAKLILALQRRIEETARFFAQGRVSFADKSS